MPMVSTINRRASFAVYSFMDSLHTPAPSTTTRLTMPSVGSVLSIVGGHGGTLGGTLVSGCGLDGVGLSTLGGGTIVSGPFEVATREFRGLSCLGRGLISSFGLGLGSRGDELCKLITGLSTLDPLGILSHKCSVTRVGNGTLSDIGSTRVNSGLALGLASNGLLYAISGGRGWVRGFRASLGRLRGIISVLRGSRVSLSRTVGLFRGNIGLSSSYHGALRGTREGVGALARYRGRGNWWGF